MRPVNLIPKEQQRRGSGISEGRTGLGVYLALGFLGLAVLGVAAVVLTSNDVNAKKDEVAQLDRDTATAKASADALRPFGSFAQVEQARVDTVNSLLDTSFNWERTLRSLSRTIPSNVWLTSFIGTVSPSVKVEAEGGGAAASARGKTNAPAVALGGCTYSHSAVARMMVRMRNLDNVSEVLLQSSEKSDSAEQSAASDTGGGDTAGDDCRTTEDIAKFEILVVLGHDPTQAAAASAATGTVAGPGAAPAAAAQGAAATASSTSSSGTSAP